jgi:anti-sigma B factor antagonist
MALRATALILPWHPWTRCTGGDVRDAIRVQRLPGRLLVIGDLDMSTAPELGRVLAAFDGQAMVLDLGGVEFIDSSGIHLLMKVRRDHPQVRVENPTATARRIFDLAGVTDLLLDEPSA